MKQLAEFGRYQIEDSVARVRVPARRYKSRRLVEDNRYRGLDVHEFPLHFHVVSRPGLSAEIGADLPVNRHLPGLDQVVALTPRTQTSRSQKTV